MLHWGQRNDDAKTKETVLAVPGNANLYAQSQAQSKAGAAASVDQKQTGEKDMTDILEAIKPPTYTYSELDAISQTLACRYAQVERNCMYEKDWPEFFIAWRFHADGTRAF